MKPRIRLLIADDHEIFRDGFRLLFRNEPDITICGEAADGKELIAKVHALRPDVVATDIQMPSMSGIEATRYIKANFPETKVIALAMFNEISDVSDMLSAGAQGFLLKNTEKEDIIEAIRTVHDNKSYFCHDTREKITRIIRLRIFKKKQVLSQVAFSERELQIIRLICQEYSTKQIAGELKLSDRTIDWHRENIMQKTGAKTLAGIIVYALTNDIYEHHDE